MILPRLATRILLALALVLAQQAGALHRLEHATGQLHGLAQESACETCLAMVALDAPIVANLPRLHDLAEAVVEAPAMRPAGVLAAFSRAAYRSRAPPPQSA